MCVFYSVKLQQVKRLDFLQYANSIIFSCLSFAVPSLLSFGITTSVSFVEVIFLVVSLGCLIIVDSVSLGHVVFAVAVLLAGVFFVVEALLADMIFVVAVSLCL